jgi:hypothetical protein
MFGLLALLGLCCLLAPKVQAGHPLKEVVYLSRECANGWSVDSQDGDKVTMVCYESDPNEQ